MVFFEEYKKDSERTEKKFPKGQNLGQKQMELLHHIMGISTESGELLDALKKHLIYGRELDETNIKEEIGDLMWYIAGTCRILDLSLPQICGLNISKLEKRYPEKFTEENEKNRDTEAERRILEKEEK